MAIVSKVGVSKRVKPFTLQNRKGIKAIHRVFVPNFDGVDDYAVLPYRAINPDGDNVLEFFSVETTNTTILAQNISATIGAREFQLWQGDSMELNLTFGGSTTNLCTVAQGYISGRKYFLTLTGTSFTLARDSAENIIRSATFTKGAAREPAAQTLIMCRSAGTGSFASFSRGLQYNIRINGVLWPIQGRNQTIQLPSPSGLGAELVSNPSSSELGPWTYSGGTLSASAATAFSVSMAFPVSVIAGQRYLLEYEITSMTGSVRPRLSGGSNVNGTTEATIGIKRLLVTAVTGNNAILFQAIAEGTSLSIKNISFKPLSVVNSTELVVNGDFSDGSTGWTTQSGAGLSVTSGQATITTAAGQNSRIEQTLTVQGGFYHEASFDIVALNTVTFARLSVFRGAVGGFAQLADVTRNSAGRISVIFFATGNDAVIQVRGDFSTAGSVIVDNVSVRKLDSLCNPLSLVNTTSGTWNELTFDTDLDAKRIKQNLNFTRNTSSQYLPLI